MKFLSLHVRHALVGVASFPGRFSAAWNRPWNEAIVDGELLFQARIHFPWTVVSNLSLFYSTSLVKVRLTFFTFWNSVKDFMNECTKVQIPRHHNTVVHVA